MQGGCERIWFSTEGSTLMYWPNTSCNSPCGRRGREWVISGHIRSHAHCMLSRNMTMHACICIYVCICVCICVCIYVCICVCICVYILCLYLCLYLCLLLLDTFFLQFLPSGPDHRTQSGMHTSMCGAVVYHSEETQYISPRVRHVSIVLMRV